MDAPELKINPYDKLCYYDPRQPDYDPENGEPTDPCFCDNCFYGRHEMAEQIINLINFIEKIS